MFLLGSGASTAAGMPMVRAITERVLGGKDVFYSSDDSYHTGEAPSELIARETEIRLYPVLRFINRLKAVVDRYDDPSKHACNYEDIHFLATQIHDAMHGEYENPAVVALLDTLRAEKRLFEPAPKAFPKKEWRLDTLADETSKYIHGVVTDLLSGPTSAFDILPFIVQASDETTTELTICTLNHDTVLGVVTAEKKFRRSGIKRKPLPILRNQKIPKSQSFLT